MVFVFERQVSRVNASALKGYLLDFIRVEYVVDKRSKTSKPPFVWSCIVCTLCFFRDFNIIMHGWQYNYILLTTFLFINVGITLDFLFCVTNVHDKSFLSISNCLYLFREVIFLHGVVICLHVFYAYMPTSYMLHGAYNGDDFL